MKKLRRTSSCKQLFSYLRFLRISLATCGSCTRRTCWFRWLENFWNDFTQEVQRYIFTLIHSLEVCPVFDFLLPMIWRKSKLIYFRFCSLVLLTFRLPLLRPLSFFLLISGHTGMPAASSSRVLLLTPLPPRHQNATRWRSQILGHLGTDRRLSRRVSFQLCGLPKRTGTLPGADYAGARWLAHLKLVNYGRVSVWFSWSGFSSSTDIGGVAWFYLTVFLFAFALSPGIAYLGVIIIMLSFNLDIEIQFNNSKEAWLINSNAFSSIKGSRFLSKEIIFYCSVSFCIITCTCNRCTSK